MSSPTNGSESSRHGKGKPCNVWNCARSVKKSCVASDLTVLLAKGRQKLGISEDTTVRIVLDNDGTEIDDDDYFQLLDDFSTFLFLIDSEEWSPRSSIRMLSEFHGRRDSQDSANGDSTDATDAGGFTLSGDRRADQLLEQLTTDGAYKTLLPWLLLRPVDLEEIVNADSEVLYLKYSRQVVDEIQEMSSKALNDYNSAQKAVELLNLYDEAARRKV